MPLDALKPFESVKAAVLGALSTPSVGALTGLLAAITDAHCLTTTERQRLESAYKGIGEFLSEDERFKDVAIRVDVQGSMLIGTTTRPEGKAEVDVDLVLLLVQGLENHVACTRLLNATYASLEVYAEIHGLKAHRKCRCVQLQYADQMHADVTPVVRNPRNFGLYGAHHGLVPDRDLSKYNGTNPEGYGLWFGDAASKVPAFYLRRELEVLAKAEVSPLPPVAVFDRLLSRIIQLYKIHRNIMFRDEPGVAPTSTFITTIATRAYIAALGEEFASPLDLVFRVWNDMLRFVEVRYSQSMGEHWVVLNPAAEEDNLAERMNTRDRQAAFRAWHERFGLDLLSLAELYSGRGPGVDEVAKSVTKSFGEKSGRGVATGIRAFTDAQRMRKTVIVPTRSMAAAPLILNSPSHRFFGRSD